MSDDWDFYALRVDDQPASIFVDLGIRKEAPIKSHFTMAYLRVFMLKPKENGLSSQEEFDDLIALEDQVTAAITQDSSVIYVGRNTSSGNRDFFFYTYDSKRFEKAAQAAMRGFPAYKYETGAREDRSWRTYFEFLHPSKRDMQRIVNRRVCEQLAKHGDDPNNQRKIDHLALLPSAEAQAAFEHHVALEGFAIDCAPEEGDEYGQFSVEFSRSDRPAEIDEIVIPLLEKVIDLGGSYDGWGCHVAP